MEGCLTQQPSSFNTSAMLSVVINVYCSVGDVMVLCDGAVYYIVVCSVTVVTHEILQMCHE
jgi:hypothetical protein